MNKKDRLDIMSNDERFQKCKYCGFSWMPFGKTFVEVCPNCYEHLVDEIVEEDTDDFEYSEPLDHELEYDYEYEQFIQDLYKLRNEGSNI